MSRIRRRRWRDFMTQADHFPRDYWSSFSPVSSPLPFFPSSLENCYRSVFRVGFDPLDESNTNRLSRSYPTDPRQEPAVSGRFKDIMAV